MKLPRVCFIFQLSSEFTVKKDFGHERRQDLVPVPGPFPGPIIQGHESPVKKFPAGKQDV